MPIADPNASETEREPEPEPLSKIRQRGHVGHEFHFANQSF